ncbi:MAG: LysM peptidoglycan-binding domain-containing protein [Bacteroidia bacterium]
MKLKNYIFLPAFLLTLSAAAQSIAPAKAPTLKKDSVVTTTFEDDPIAAMLDSLSNLQYFDKTAKKSSLQKRIIGKYHFSADSVPQYDDKIYEARLAKLDAQSPFDLAYNDAVKQYILLYAVRRRDLVSRIMAMSKLYFPMFEELLDKYNLPLELKYLAVVESALNPSAKSRTGARGLWQFMYTTGKMYNLNTTSYVDERSDPYKSTVAACEYFQYLYDTFGDWQLVLAAYNSGPGTVSRAIRRSGGKTNYWAIRPYLPKETQGYVPAFIAVNYVLNYTAEHNIFSAVPQKTYFQVDTVKIKQQLSFNQISSVLHIPISEIEFLNPEYKLDVVPYNPDGEESSLCLPKEDVGTFITNETAIYNYLKTDTATSEQILAMQASEPIAKTYRVKKGEHLSTIASRYKCSVRELKEWNNLRSYNIHAGEKLTIYITSGGNRAKESYAANKKQRKNVSKNNNSDYYTIQNGDTLWSIAKAHGLSVEKLKKINNFSDNQRLKKGSKIIIAMAGN